MKASDILLSLKERDDGPTFTMVKANPIHLQLVAAWTSMQLQEDEDPDEECPPDTPAHLRLRWLWARIEPDPTAAWIEMSGLPDAPHVRRACRVLQDNGVVHPDGDVAASVRTFMNLAYTAATTPPRGRGG